MILFTTEGKASRRLFGSPTYDGDKPRGTEVIVASANAAPSTSFSS